VATPPRYHLGYGAILATAKARALPGRRKVSLQIAGAPADRNVDPEGCV